MEGSIRCSANYIIFSPISFWERSAIIYRDKPSVVYGNIVYTWRQTLERCTRLVSTLAHLRVSYGEVVMLLYLITFIRRFRLPDNAKIDQVKAAMKSGVLTVTECKEEKKRKTSPCPHHLQYAK
ncbi:hypothetical protein ACFX2C_020554 [Malus domestica]